MTIIIDAIVWIATASNWTGSGGIWVRLAQHLAVTAGVVILACLIALPTGLLIGHSRRGTVIIPLCAGAARSLPTLGLLTLCGLWVGVGITAPFLALLVLAMPPLLAGAYAGVASVDPKVVEAARAIGLSPWQILQKVEIPLAMPVIMEGIRSTILQVVATATLAAYTADAGLGRFLFTGLKTRDWPQMLAGAILVVLLALCLDALSQYLQDRYSQRRLIATR
ncbi:ABC transporter permease [Schaalia suimastitidis]|uniref:ABC transporter permease n=1 Tax=Schaalia suimastitidis TaxID=121163 RepID=UPI00041F51A6|nr:ABC transporter permease [Schaalia suimastitidis]